MKCGAITSGYAGDLKTSIKILNEALATEWVCVLRYQFHYYAADGIDSRSIAQEFLEHSKEETKHAERIALRIKQLGGKADFNPATFLSRSHSEYHEGTTLIEMIQEDLIAERIAIESYQEMIRYFGDKDPTSRRLMEDILAQEEEHAEELSSLLLALDPTQRPEVAA
jgi:bacterioferritin